MQRKFIAHALAAAVAAAALGSCGNPEFEKLKAGFEVAVSKTVSPSAIIVAADAFDIAEATATRYLSLPRCRVNGPVICRSPTATAELVPAIRSGIVARNTGRQFLLDHPGALGTAGLYDAMISTTKALEAIFDKYGIGARS